MSRISSLDSNYTTGKLSTFPVAIDTTTQLYEARNNAETTLKQSLAYNGRYIVVEDASEFPPTGLLRLGAKGEGGPSPAGDFDAELLYYGQRSNTVFSQLIRGFAGSRQNAWPANSTFVSASVMAEYHNAIKDAIINIEQFIGLSSFPDPTSLNGMLETLEDRYLAPKPLFRSYPVKGPHPLTVTFQNFSEGGAIRYLWDFGDGTTSIEQSPTHTYLQEGTYSVKLNIITAAGAQGVSTKINYINVNDEDTNPFFYALPMNPGPNYSIATATTLSVQPQKFIFVDQTNASIQQRYWVFDDGTNLTVTDPDVHTTTHIYETPGVYVPSLLLVFADQTSKRVFLTGELQVI